MNGATGHTIVMLKKVDEGLFSPMGAIEIYHRICAGEQLVFVLKDEYKNIKLGYVTGIESGFSANILFDGLPYGIGPEGNVIAYD